MITRAEIQAVKSLADKRGRTEHRAFIAEGEKLIDELRQSSLHLRRIFATHPIWSDAEVISAKEMERISQLKTASDSLAVVEIPNYDLRLANPQKGLVLALDRVQNPGNLGTIIRLADWFGITDIICSEDCADCFNPKVVQATMGAIIRVRVHYTDLVAWLTAQREKQTPIYGTFLDGDNIYERPLSECGVVVMGNEGQGISAAVGSTISDRLFIPPYPPTRNGSESLNVAIATAVVCSEFRRRR